MTSPPGSIIFEAQHEYEPTNIVEIALKRGDQLYVQKPVADPRGWLHGFNTRSRENGQFPGTYCTILNENASLPPLPPKPVPAARKETFVGKHRLVKFHTTKPRYCKNCNDYIWGGSVISLLCSLCRCSSHLACHKIFLRQECKVFPKDEEDDLTKPLKEWNTTEVVEWVFSAHLHPYAQLFQRNNVTGEQLGEMKLSHLKELGVPFDFHAHNIHLCIQELISEPPKDNQIQTAIDLSESSQIKTHTLLEHTFTTLQSCDVCQKPMFGVVRQGIMCCTCGIQFHRYCAVLCRQTCSKAYIRARRHSDSLDPSFCCNFNSNSIPPVMGKCINTVSTKGIDRPNIYRDNCEYEECRTLRAALNQNASNVNMDDPYWSDPLCAAYVLKSFLLELPKPLVPFERYNDFINISESENMTEDDIKELLLRAVPEPNYPHLEFLLRHLFNVAKRSDFNNMTVADLAYEFAILILRPPDNDIWTFASNLSHQELVVKKLISAMQETSGVDFSEEMWLWPEATRKDISERLSGTPDGSFSIRQSEGRFGEYTLTVRKEGRERLIKIIQRNGRYGFREEYLNFDSLSGLVHHFRDHSLEDYNPKLSIKLCYPCGRRSQLQVTDSDKDLLWKRYQDVVEKLNHVKVMEMKLEEKQMTLEECKVLSESQIDVVNFLEEQIDHAQKFFEEAAARDRTDLQSSICTLNKLLNEEKETWASLDQELTTLKNECDQLTSQLTEKCPEVPQLQEEYNQLEPRVRKEFPKEFKDESGFDETNFKEVQLIYDTIPSFQQQQERGTELREEYWLFQELDRNTVISMLRNKPSGTFLVRSSRNYPYVISMVYEDSVKHIPILQGPNGYGFAEPHNIYRTLGELINHYHHTSLRMHNRSLDTTLQFPYRFLETTEDDQIYEAYAR